MPNRHDEACSTRGTLPPPTQSTWSSRQKARWVGTSSSHGSTAPPDDANQFEAIRYGVVEYLATVNEEAQRTGIVMGAPGAAYLQGLEASTNNLLVAMRDDLGIRTPAPTR